MVRNEQKKLNISLKETHLLDIYAHTNKYLELGTLSLDAIEKILNYELVELDEIAYLPIQNLGFSKTNIKNEILKAIIPYFYFQNINQKSSYQVFITHGMIKYKELDKKERFAPLILIPVNIFYEKGKILFELISEPIENVVLINKLRKDKKLNLQTLEHLTNLVNIEKYLNNFEKNYELILENFLTYAEVNTKESYLDLNKFNFTKTFPNFLDDNLYSLDYIPYYSKKYNRNQRHALHLALEGKSFVITGRLGTGKTTCLRDIAINAIANDKKVLYVSNQKETLDSIYDFFKNKNMHYFVENFANSFSSFNRDITKEEKEEQELEIDLKSLLDNYKFIKDYQKAFSLRILDHRFVDVINELVLLNGEDKKFLEIDNLENIYKYEYLEILKALENIQINLKEINDFKNSVWKDIPLINDVKYPNQVISLIHKVYTGFNELEKQKDLLEKNYGFKTINNYAYLKNIIHNFKGLNIKTIPASWLSKENYEKAKVEYHRLKTLIFTLQELEYDLDIKFDNLSNFNVFEELKTLYGEFFTKDDLDKINQIIEDRLNIIVKLNRVTAQIELFNKSYSKIKKILNYNFSLDEENIFEILRLSEILTNANINHKVINHILDGNFASVLNEAKQILNNYNQYNQELTNLFTNLPLVSFGSLDETVNVFLSYSKGEKIKRSRKRILEKLETVDNEGYKKIINLIPRYFELKELIKLEDEKFRELFDFHPDEIYITDFIKINDYLENIQNLKIKSRILRFFKRFDSYSKNIYRYFDFFYKAYGKINDLYLELIQYGFTTKKDDFTSRLADLKQINNYIRRLFDSNDRLYSLKKINKNEYVKAEDYYYISESIKKIIEIKNELKENQEYKKLFGVFYQYEKTDLGKLSKLMQAYKTYIECFVALDDVSKSFNDVIYSEINKIIDNLQEIVDELNEVFKIYFKIFKNSVSRFYYTDFQENLAYLNELLHNKESLIVYLKITDGLQVLANYHLYKFIEYIVSLTDASTLVNDFKYTYLSMVKNLYLEKYPYLKNYKAFEATLKITLDLEDEIIKTVEEKIFLKISKKSGSKFSLAGLKNLDYSSYITKTSTIKHLILTNTQVLNHYLNIKDFDLVLIDDAQLFNANEYAYALQGKQVIVAGELQHQEAVANNLISRLSLSKNILLSTRYSIMPKSLKNHALGLNAPIYKNYYDNFGIEVISKDLLMYVVSLLKENKTYLINIFTSNLEYQREIYYELTNLLLENNFTQEEIITIFTKNLNLTDLKQAYLIDADFNILILEDYYQINQDYLVVNLIDNLILTRKKLIIYDSKDYLKLVEKSNFLLELEKLINKPVFEKCEFSRLINKLVKRLEEKKIQVFASSSSSFMLKAKESIYGVTIYFDSTKTNFDILNDFRDYYSNNIDAARKIIIVWAMELLDDFEGVLKRIVDEVYND